MMKDRPLTLREEQIARNNRNLVEFRLGRDIPSGTYEATDYCDSPLTGMEIETIANNINLVAPQQDFSNVSMRALLFRIFLTVGIPLIYIIIGIIYSLCEGGL